MQKIGVVGSGQMGNGIAQVSAMAGLDVVMLDIRQEFVDRGLATIGKSLDRLLKKERISEADKTAVLGRIQGTLDYGDFSDCDIVVEAATEREDLKRDIFVKLDEVCKPEAILATNTSSISITWISAVTKRPEQVIGMHFMNPVPLMKLVEIIDGLATSAATHEATVALAEKMGKTCAIAQDYPGFIANRILMPMINEAVYCLMEGVGERDAIDTTMKTRYEPPHGTAGLGGSRWPGYRVGDFGSVAQGFGRQQISSLPVAEKICGCRFPRSKNGPGILRLLEVNANPRQTGVNHELQLRNP